MPNNWNIKQLTGKQRTLGELLRKINNIIVSTPNITQVNESNANLIINGLWLGNYQAAFNKEFINSKQIKNIINATDNIPTNFSSINYLVYPIKDIDACHNNLFNMLDNGADFIDKSLSTDENILVHCKRGHHRSASIVAYYLMKYKNMSLVDSIILIKAIRPTAFRRMTCFLQSLIIYEHERIYS